MTTGQFFPFDGLQVMAYIFKQCEALGVPYNVTKLQKLMYCCDGVTLATYGKPLSSERPEAWRYGPVFPKVLRCIQAKGLDAVRGEAFEEEAPDALKDLITGTILFFGAFSATQLATWSRKIESPWYQASLGGVDLKTPIDDALITRYFKAKVLAS